MKWWRRWRAWLRTRSAVKRIGLFWKPLEQEDDRLFLVYIVFSRQFLADLSEAPEVRAEVVDRVGEDVKLRVKAGLWDVPNEA